MVFLANLTICFVLATLFSYPKGVFDRLIRSIIISCILTTCTHLAASEFNFPETSFKWEEPPTKQERDIYFKRCEFHLMMSMRYKAHAQNIWDQTPKINGTELFSSIMASYLASKTVEDVRAKATVAFYTFSTFILNNVIHSLSYYYQNYKILMVYIKESYQSAHYAYIYQEALFQNCHPWKIHTDEKYMWDYLDFENWEAVCK
jgi:hypothetical protein